MDLNLVTFMGIFAASIAGSVHCVGMCGGLMVNATGSRLQNQCIYHVSRWMGYLCAGSLAGFLGNEFLFDWNWLPLQILFSALMLSGLLIWGLGSFFPGLRGLSEPLARIPAGISKYGMSLGFKWGHAGRGRIKAGLVGFFTIFLPCGWLYSFLFLALSTHSVLGGGMILSVFWLGTVPALMGSRILIQAALARIGVKGSRIIALIMVGAAVTSFYQHWEHAAIDHQGASHDGTRAGVQERACFRSKISE